MVLLNFKRPKNYGEVRERERENKKKKEKRGKKEEKIFHHQTFFFFFHFFKWIYEQKTVDIQVLRVVLVI